MFLVQREGPHVALDRMHLNRMRKEYTLKTVIDWLLADEYQDTGFALQPAREQPAGDPRRI